MMFRSLRTRLTLSHLLVIVVAMGVLGTLLLSLAGRYFLQAMEESLLAQARLTAQAVVTGALITGPDAVQNPASNTIQQQSSNYWVETQNIGPLTDTANLAGSDLAPFANASVQLSNQLDTRIRILSAQGTVLVDSLQEQQGLVLADDPVVREALAGGTGSRTDSLLGPQAAMHVALPVLVGGRVVGAVYLSQPLRDVTAVLRDLGLLWLLATAVALILAGGVGGLLARAVARPVAELTAAAQDVAGGDLGRQVPIASHDEVGRLSRAFNEMIVRLKQARQVQTDFVANVSHELRTPLTSIKGTVETLREGAVDDVAVRDHFLATVESETDRLIRLVNDLLLLSRVDSDALQLHGRPLDLEEVVRVAVERLVPLAQARGVAVQVAGSPGLPRVQADPDRLAQVLVNLLDNAIKYSPAGGVVTVRVDRQGERVQVQVQDQGPGIPAGELDRVGERFYRTDKARSRAEGGSGLGLSIARALVEAHRGELRIESREGTGTTVTVELLPASDLESQLPQGIGDAAL
jgi:two-component system sensor histidine kinase BaeS